LESIGHSLGRARPIWPEVNDQLLGKMRRVIDVAKRMYGLEKVLPTSEDARELQA
jgi:hypothetical protein